MWCRESLARDLNGRALLTLSYLPDFDHPINTTGHQLGAIMAETDDFLVRILITEVRAN